MTAASVRRKVSDRNVNVAKEARKLAGCVSDNRLQQTFAAKSLLRQIFLTSLRRDLASRSTCNAIFINRFTLD